MDAPSASRIKVLTRLSTNIDELIDMIGSQENKAMDFINLKEALWLCCQNFNMKANKSHKDNDFHRIWIFTEDDSPNAHLPAEQAKVVQIAKDAFDAGGEISLWAFEKIDVEDHSKGSDQKAVKKAIGFDVKAFYHRILFLSDDSELDLRMTQTPHGHSFSNLAVIRQKEYRKRSLGSLLFGIGNPESPYSLQFGVQMFKIIEATKKPFPKQLYKPTSEPLKISSRYIDSYGSRVEQSSIKTYIELGGSRVYITPSEIQLLKTAETRSSGHLRLLHFASSSLLSSEWNMQAPYFIYPHDSTVKGSTLLFAALLEDMAAKDLVAVAELHRTKSSAPRIVALLPQREELDEDEGEGQSVRQRVSPGMHMIPLPFASELRPHYTTTGVSDASSASAVTEELVEATSQVISALQLPESFDYATVPNPSVQKFYAVLQAIALSEETLDWSEEKDDALVPESAQLLKAESMLSSFKSLAGLEDSSSATTVKKKVGVLFA